jgi:hypothetical protein
MNLRNLVELIDTKIVSQVGMITTLQPIKAFGLAEFIMTKILFILE